MTPVPPQLGPVVAKEELARRIRERHWYHTIDLGHGLVTNGQAEQSRLLARPGVMPSMEGRTVLDIGAWDGKFSFEAERDGASRVVALDHYMWRLDAPKRQAYYEQCDREGRLPDLGTVAHGFLCPEATPGKEGFDLLHAYLDSRVEAVSADFMTMDVNSFGQFDVVLYLGVLYHMTDPLGALDRLRRVTSGVAVIETETINLPPFVQQNLTAFYPGKECRGDYTNWFAPTEKALHGMCRAAGFRSVQTVAKDRFADIVAGQFRQRRSQWREWLPLMLGQWSGRTVVHARP